MTMLVKWGTQRADLEGIICRVEASPMGKHVYRTCGFKEIESCCVKAEGQEEGLQIWIMRREPEGKDSNFLTAMTLSG